MKHLKLSTKLHLVSGLLIAVALAVGIIGINGIRKTNAGLETVYNDRVVPLKQLKAIADDYAVAIIDAANKANAGLFTAEETLKGLETASGNIKQNWKDYMATKLTPEEAKLAKEADALFISADAAVETFRKHLAGKTGSLKGTLGDFDGPLYEHIDPISSKITELVELQLRVAKEEYHAAHALFNTVLWLSVVTLILGTVLAGGFGWMVIRSITRVLRGVTERLALGADQTASAANQVSGTSQLLAEGASEQAASLEETSASLEEISSMTQRNAQNVQNAKDFTAQTRATAESGAQSTQEMGHAMNGIRTASGEMRDAMNSIKAASNDVAKIIKTIDEIAFQTNILALNAAVEAARAGEAGMGFAVVADEVRNLAQRSAKAAKETADMIETSIKRSDDGVRVTDKVVSSVEEVATKSQQLEQKLAEILAKAKQVDEQVVQIAAASQEQSQGISEVNMAVGQMDKVTQSNAASAEESAAAAEELNTQAAALQGAVRELQHLVGGRSDAPTAPSPTPAPHPAPARTFQALKKPGLANKPAAPKPARPAKDLDIPMPEPIGAGSAKSGFQDF
jgi:methyl-accepting chemotaxis protein